MQLKRSEGSFFIGRPTDCRCAKRVCVFYEAADKEPLCGL